LLNVEDLHNKILYPTVLVRTEKAGGSGTCIASIHAEDEYKTYILTNWHVVESAIRKSKKWDPLVGRDVEVEIRAPVTIEFYKYRRLSILDRTDNRRADIVAWDKDGDVALLELLSESPPEHIAEMLPREDIHSIRMFMPIIACGCAMGHKPIATEGFITSLDERIENLSFWLANTATIFGNSGGGQFLKETGQFIGIPSRLDVVLLGFAAQAITHLSYFIPIGRIYNLLEDWEYQFIFDPDYTYEDCAKRRKEKQDELQRAWERRWRRERELAQGGGVAEGNPEKGAEETEETGVVDVFKKLWGVPRPE
jgi:hypothetical protein